MTTETELQARIPAQVRNHRHRLGLTQEQLAERSGLQVESISRIENGRVPEIATLERLAVALGVTMGELLDPEPGVGELTDAEIDLLRLFRGLPPDAQNGLMSVLRRTRSP